jgi:hypothetical protein
MGSMKNPPPSTTTTKQEPWGQTVPYWQQTFGDIYGSPTRGTTPETPSVLRALKKQPDTLNNYQGRYGEGGLIGQQLANPNANITQAWDMTRTAANDPTNTQMLTGSRDYANRVLSGEFLDPTKNLAMAQQWQRGLEGIGSGWDTSATQAGRYGSGAWAAGRGQQLGDLQAGLYGQGLNQMTQMAGMAPSIYNAQYLPSQYLNALGQEQEQRPWDIYGKGASMLQMPGGGSTQTPYFKPSPLQGLLGLGMMGMGMASGNPYAIGSGASAIGGGYGGRIGGGI